MLDVSGHLLLSPLQLLVAAGVVGLILGSFLNVVIWRLNAPLLGLSASGNLYAPRSYCPNCRHSLRWWQLIPLVSFVGLRGRCRYCRAPISWQYPLVELASAVVCIGLAWYWGWSLELGIWSLFALWALALCVSDWRWMLLPDHLTLSLLWFGLLLNSFGVWTSLTSAVHGAALGFGLLWAVNALYKLLRGREGMGGGDQKLLAALGACFGLPAIWPIILLASLGGCLQALAQYLITRKVPIVIFGPWLIIAAIAYWSLRHHWPLLLFLGSTGA